jgi:hypothetical protein
VCHSFNNISGQLPGGISQLVELKTLILGNGFSGNLPDVSALKTLENLDVGNSQVNGIIPVEILLQLDTFKTNGSSITNGTATPTPSDARPTVSAPSTALLVIVLIAMFF